MPEKFTQSSSPSIRILNPIKYNTYLFIFRRYQYLVDQQESLIWLKILLKSKLSSVGRTNVSDFNKRIENSTLRQLTDLHQLQREHDSKRKCLEQKIRNKTMKKMFQDVMNLQEIICIEVKQCDIIEREIFQKLSMVEVVRSL